MKVHVLFHGVSYCNMEGVPADWPDGHKWVPVPNYKEVTCFACRKKLLDNAVLCVKCGAVLIDGNGCLMAGARSTPTSTHCHPECS